MKRCASMLLGIAMLAGCGPPSTSPTSPRFQGDIGPDPRTPGRQTVGFSAGASKALEDTGFLAVVRPEYYIDRIKDVPEPTAFLPDFFSIEVQYPNGGPYNASTVCFSRTIPAVELPPEVLKSTAQDLVSFEPTSRLVTFRVGKKEYTYTLPAVK